jgi:surfeit locus 1 family protein
MKINIGKRQFCPGLITSLIALIVFSLFISLGFWQLDRAAQKRILFADFEARQAGKALQLSDETINTFEKDDLLWRPVDIRGEFLEQFQILLDNRVEQGQAGYFVYTPFILDGGKHVVLVNRGWLKAGDDRQVAPPLESTASHMILNGVIKSEPKTGMLLKNAKPEQLGANIYRVQNINIDELEQLTKTKLMPYIMRLSPESEGGYFRQWQPPGSGVAMHMGYAFQWFAFAVALLIIYLLLNFKKTEQDKADE